MNQLDQKGLTLSVPLFYLINMTSVDGCHACKRPMIRPVVGDSVVLVFLDFLLQEKA